MSPSYYSNIMETCYVATCKWVGLKDAMATNRGAIS